MYQALLSFEDFIAEVRRQEAPTVYLQSTIKEDVYGGVVSGMRSHITLTAQGAGAILVARCQVESIDMLSGDSHAREVALQRRAAEARELVSAAVGRRTLATVAPGMLIEPGMLDDLPKISSSQQVWTWLQAREPLARAIVPTEPTDHDQAGG